MSQSSAQKVGRNEGREKQNRAAASSSLPIRIRHKTKSKLEQLLRQANKDRPGRKIKADDLICFSLDLINDQHISAICDKMLTNKDRMELLFQKFSKERRGATREDFLGMLLEGK